MAREHQDYVVPSGGLPPQTTMVTSRAIVRPRYMILPPSVTPSSNLPFWKETTSWILAAPQLGFGVGFAEYLLYVGTGGGCQEPEFEDGVEGFLFVLEGRMQLTIEGDAYDLPTGGYAYLPPDTDWTLCNEAESLLKLLWLRKLYEPLDGLAPQTIVGHEQEAGKYLIPSDDMAYDLNMNIVSLEPGANVPITELHVMEHGLYMLQGKGVYLLGENWHEVQAGDFIWMRAYCPQSYYAGGPETTRYLLYKNVNRHISLLCQS